MRIVKVFLAFALWVSVCDAQWAQLGQLDRGMRKIAVCSSSLFVVTADSGSVLQSTDGGTNWSQLIESGARTFSAFENGVAYVAKAGLWDAGGTLLRADSLYRSTDGGLTWALTPPPTNEWGSAWYSDTPVGIEACLNGNLLISMAARQMRDGWSYSYLSTDNGTSWEESVGGAAFAFRGDSVVTYGGWWESPGGALDATLWLSSNGGVKWDSISSWGYGYSSVGPGWHRPLAWCSNGNIFSSTGYNRDSLIRSMDLGISWSAVSSLVPSALLALQQGGVLVGTDTTGVYLFTDDGDNVGTLNDGLTDLHIHTFALDGSGYAYVGTDKGIWRRPISELVVSVNPMASEIPATFVLHQNYPNPFNPTTTLEFSIVNTQFTILKVYDVLGREAATLVNEVKLPGRYTVEWNANGAASGVYFYRLNAGDFVSVKKMMLIR